MSTDEETNASPSDAPPATDETAGGGADEAKEPYRIVVGVDFGQTGDDAIVEALRIVREHPNDELHPVHVIPTSGTSDAKKLDAMADEMDKAGEKLRRRVLDIARDLFPAETWHQPMVFHVRVGKVAETLHQVAIDVTASMVVVGHRFQSGVERLILGSSAEKLVRIAHLPVLIARPPNFEGLEPTAKPDPRRPGEVLHDSHYAHSELVRVGGRTSKIPGLL